MLLQCKVLREEATSRLTIVVQMKVDWNVPWVYSNDVEDLNTKVENCLASCFCNDISFLKGFPKLWIITNQRVFEDRQKQPHLKVCIIKHQTDVTNTIFSLSHRKYRIPFDSFSSVNYRHFLEFDEEIALFVMKAGLGTILSFGILLYD